MRNRSVSYLSNTLFACILFSSAAQATNVIQSTATEYAPSGKGWGVPAEPYYDSTSHLAGSHTAIAQNGIYYHGGPVMLNTHNIYYIWYGDWSNNSAITILNNLANNIGGSAYLNITTTYTDGSNQPIANVAKLQGSTFDRYSHGRNLNDSAVFNIVTRAINNRSLPNDPNGVYFVLTSKDVRETSGFCTQYCGWHDYSFYNKTNIKFAFIGNPERCPSACEAQTTSPNNNPGADGMANIIAHEFEEAISDPNLNAWYDKSGEENADKCAWTFGTTYTTNNGSAANMLLGNMNYLIQQNWVNYNSGYCALKY